MELPNNKFSYYKYSRKNGILKEFYKIFLQKEDIYIGRCAFWQL